MLLNFFAHIKNCFCIKETMACMAVLGFVSNGLAQQVVIEKPNANSTIIKGTLTPKKGGGTILPSTKPATKASPEAVSTNQPSASSTQHSNTTSTQPGKQTEANAALSFPITPNVTNTEDNAYGVDTTGFSKIPTYSNTPHKEPTPLLVETVDTSGYKKPSKKEVSATANTAQAPKEMGLGDLSTDYTSPSGETIDTALFNKRKMAPKFDKSGYEQVSVSDVVIPASPQPSNINTAVKSNANDYIGEYVKGAYAPVKGKSITFEPKRREIATNNQVDSSKVAKTDSMGFHSTVFSHDFVYETPGLTATPAPKVLGELAEIPKVQVGENNEVNYSNMLGELAELPANSNNNAEQTASGNNGNLGELGKINPNDIVKKNDSQKPKEEAKTDDGFYTFDDGFKSKGTEVKVLTDKKPVTTNNTTLFIPKQGQSNTWVPQSEEDKQQGSSTATTDYGTRPQASTNTSMPLAPARSAGIKYNQESYKQIGKYRIKTIQPRVRTKSVPTETNKSSIVMKK